MRNMKMTGHPPRHGQGSPRTDSTVLRALLGTLLLLMPGWVSSATAQHILRDVRQGEPNRPRAFLLPYAFSSETFGFSMGATGVVSGLCDSDRESRKRTRL